MEDEKVLTKEEEAALAAQQKQVISDDDFEAEVEKRLGVKSSELVKKSDQRVITPEEKAEADEARKKEVLKFALDRKIYSTQYLEEYAASQQTSKIEVLRKNYISDHPEDKNASKTFDKIFRIDEDDEDLDSSGEKLKPNEAKKAALAMAEKMADDHLNLKFGKIKDAGTSYEAHLAEQATIKENTALVAKTIADLPTNYEIATEYDKYNFKFDKADLKEAEAMILQDAKSKKLSPEEVKENAVLFLKTKNLPKIIAEVERVAMEKAKDRVERGNLGIPPKLDAMPTGSDPMVAFAKEKGLIPK